MATSYLNIEGTVKWINGKFGGLFEPDPEYGTYQLTFYPNPDAWDKIKKSGLRLEPKNDEDGDFLKFRRRKQQLLKGELVDFGRPKVFFKEGIEGTRDIGNGSTVQASVAVYDTNKGKGHRLESVTVLELVRFERTGGDRGYVEFKDKVENEEPTDEGSDTDVSTEGNSGEEQAPEVPFSDEVPFGSGDKDQEEKVVTPKKTASPFKRMSR